MPTPPWIIIGIAGVTCGGKTTLAKLLHQHLKTDANALGDHVRIRSVHMINQDHYFYDESSDHHTWLTRLNHINWEILSALNMPKMCSDIRQLLGSDCTLYNRTIPSVVSLLMPAPSDAQHTVPATTVAAVPVNVLIIEGFTIFNNANILAMCHLKFHLHLPYEKCYERRSNRVYEPADVIGYFESCVWPMYEKHFNEYRERHDLIVLNGEASSEKCFAFLLRCIRDSI